MSRRAAASAWLPLLAVAAMLAGPARSAVDRPLWELGVGASALSLPHYRGAERSRRWLLPLPWAVYRGEVLRANREGLKARLVDSERIDFDLSVAATAPSRSADEPVRAGMADLAGTLEFGPNLNLRLAGAPGWKLEARLPLRAAMTLESRARGIGWSAMPNLNLDLARGPWNIGAQFGLPWGSRRLHGHFYDVPAADATAARAAYQARGGRGGWQATLGASRRDGDRWFGAFMRADSVSGAVFEDSPLVRRSRSWSLGVAYAWILWQSGRLVPDPDEIR